MNINATLLVQALSFAALIWFTVKFVWPMLTNAIDDRNKRIADGLAAAEKGRRCPEGGARTRRRNSGAGGQASRRNGRAGEDRGP